MKKSVLIIYYSQSGQLKKIVDSIFSLVSENCDIEYKEIKPVKKFPLPWKEYDFFDCMPECVLENTEAIEPITFTQKKYDLVVLAYQPWFLSPSIPISSFLQNEASGFLKNQTILTVIGARNMWLNAQEKVKKQLNRLQANLVGNIVLVDKNPNLISVLSINRWAFTGKKEKTYFLPEAGVQTKDIEESKRFGPIILEAINNSNFHFLHDELLKANSIQLKESLILLEKRAIKNFRKFAVYIQEKGERGNIKRKNRVLLFSKLLWIGIFILSPISSLTAKLTAFFTKNKIQKEVSYFTKNKFRENAI